MQDKYNSFFIKKIAELEAKNDELEKRIDQLENPPPTYEQAVFEHGLLMSDLCSIPSNKKR